jgi:hypothetical protein
MKRSVSSSHGFAGPWWLAAALLRIEGPELVAPVLEELRVHLSGSTSVERTAEVEYGPVERGRGLVTMPVSWQDATHPGAFPKMHGELRLSERGDTTTDLEFFGEYEPPLGPIGALGDTIAGHRLAEQTVKNAVARLARVFETAVSEHVGTKWASSASDV